MTNNGLGGGQRQPSQPSADVLAWPMAVGGSLAMQEEAVMATAGISLVGGYQGCLKTKQH